MDDGYMGLEFHSKMPVVAIFVMIYAMLHKWNVGHPDPHIKIFMK